MVGIDESLVPDIIRRLSVQDSDEFRDAFTQWRGVTGGSISQFCGLARQFADALERGGRDITPDEQAAIDREDAKRGV